MKGRGFGHPLALAFITKGQVVQRALLSYLVLAQKEKG